MKHLHFPRLTLKLVSFCASALLVSATAIAQASFSTTTYPNNNLWNPDFHVRADLNGDGREDFISGAGNWGCAGSFAVTLSTGDGTYAAPVCYTLPAGQFLVGLVVGDFYGTGNLDVAAGNDIGNLYIYKNATGNGTLTVASTLTLPSGYGVGLAADVNHDGHIDLVLGQSSVNGGGSVQALFGNGDGTFSNGPITTFTNMKEPAGRLATGDFDGDGKADIMVSGGNDEAAILYGDGKGNFTPGPDVGSNHTFLTRYEAFDIDSEGTMDLIGAPYTYPSGSTVFTSYNYLDIEWGHYDRTLTSQKVPLTHCPISDSPPQVADFDGDGVADLVVAEDSDCKGDGPYTLNFMKGNGGGSFQPEQVIYSTGDQISEWHVMRASHSNKPDLTVWQFQDVNNTITNPEGLVLVNTTTGDFTRCTPLNSSATGINVCSPTSTVGAKPQLNFSFAGSNQTPGRDMEIWIDGQKVSENLKNTYGHYSFIDDHLSLNNGEHQVAVYSVGWDYSLLLTQFPLLVGSDVCPPPGEFGVNVCSPINNSTLTSPVLAYAAGAVASGRTIVRMEVWVDGVKMYSTLGSNTLQTSLKLAAGWHQFTYYIVDNSGNTTSKTSYAAVN